MQMMKNLVWSVRRVGAISRRYIIMSSVLAAAEGILPSITLLLTQKLLDILQNRSGTALLLTELVLLTVGLEGLQQLIETGGSTCISNEQIRCDTAIQSDILAKASRLSCRQFEDPDVQDLLSRVQYDAGNALLGSVQQLIRMAGYALNLIISIVYVAGYSLPLVFISAVVPVLQFLFETRGNLRQFRATLQNTQNQRKAGYLSWLLLSPESIREIKMYRLFGKYVRRFRELRRKCDDDRIRNANWLRRRLFFCACLDIAVDLLTTGVLVRNAYLGEILLGQFVLYTGSMSRIRSSIDSMLSSTAVIADNLNFTGNVRKFFVLPDEVIRENGIRISDIRTIELKDVGYSYDGCTMVLKHISFTLKTGDFVVLAGRNGSGKTTLLKILMGIYPDYSGDIFVNGINLKQISLPSYREKTAVLFQDYVRYETSVRENIENGLPEGRHLSDQTLTGLLGELGMADLAEELDRPLGLEFEGGRQLSSGQWQKLASLRCLMRSGQLYIFDEFNASMDAESQNLLMRRIRKQASSGIVLMTLHRLMMGVMSAGRILVLDRGELREAGTHAELLKQGGLYAELVRQSKESLGYGRGQ